MIGLNEMFFEDGDDQVGQNNQGAVYTSSYKSNILQYQDSLARPKNCAGSLDLPPLPKQKSKLVGLLNQGATCYLNSLFQTLFLTPQLRQAIYQLPLCEGSIDNFTNFLTGKRREILFNIQKLFVRLQEEDSRAVSTDELTKAFGWVNNEEMAQQDVQELNRVLFDTIERSLKDTPYETLIDELYRGNLSHMIVCQQCGTIRKREEKFLDLMLQVKNCKGVDESLKRLFEMESLTEDNKLFCDTCNEKTSTLKGQRIQKLPPVLTFGLARFDIDYQRWERYKVNDKFEYPLELDLSEHLDPESIELPENCQYELKSIIIHRGGAYGGHYHAYIQDELKEGDWYLQMPEEFQKDPKLVEKVQYDPKRFMTEEQIKEAEEAKLRGEDPTLQIDLDNQKQQQDQSQQNNQNNGKNNKKGKNKGNNKQNNQKQNQNNQNSQKKQEKKKKEIEYEYDECDFPLPYSEKRLIENWYDFDDSSVTPILPGKLQSQFGGSNHNAYILVYRQKKISQHLQNEQPPRIPDYWKPAIENINEINIQQRAYYQELENQLDIILQDEALFKIDPETYFIQYVEDSKIDEQGLKLRLHFTDKIGEVKHKIGEFLNLQHFNIFEVDRLRSGFCHLLNDWRKLDQNVTLKDSKVTHLSTWIVVKEEQLIQQLGTVCGENVQPIKIKLRFYGEEIEQFVYNNMTMEEFLQKVESITSIPAATVSLKIVEDTVIRRIDRQLKNTENPTLPNTLRDVKVVDGTAILVEMKDENQIATEADEVQHNLNQALKSGDQDVVDIDDTPNIRSVIVNKEFEENDHLRFKINIDWTLKQLNDFLVKEMQLEEPQRMRNHTTSRLFVKEELDTQLRSYPDFQTGGARIQMESGRYPTIQEIVIKAVVYKKEEDLKQFYFPVNFTVKECKEQMAKEFGVDPAKHTLYRVDHLEEPAFPLRREKSEITKCHVSSGDLLILKSDSTLSAEDKLTLHIHMTLTGQPDDSQYIDKLEVNREYSLRDLKDIILSMPQFDFAKNYPIEQIRVREKQNNMFFGKIFRDLNKSLKSQQITNNAQIVIQVLQQPEELDQNTMVLLVTRRNVETRTYGQKTELLFKHKNAQPTIAELEQSIRQYYNVGADERISIAKYFPHKFEWKWMDKNEEIVEKKKKGKETKILAGNADLKKIPFFLKDGDIIGVRFESENIQGDDDFQTSEDIALKAEFAIRKAEEEKIREDEKKKQNTGKKQGRRDDGAGIRIRLDEDYPVEQDLKIDSNDASDNANQGSAQEQDNKDEVNVEDIQKQD